MISVILCQLGLHARRYVRNAAFVYEEHRVYRCVVCRREFWKTIRRGA